MAIQEFMAKQLRKPSGLIGRLFTSRMLNKMNAPINRLTLESLELEPNDEVLEVGFGGGDLIARMAQVVVEGHIAGVDFSPEMVARGKRRLGKLVRAGRVELQVASAEALPYEAPVFDKACTVNAIYFWPDPIQPLKEFHRVLRDGGRLVVSFSPGSTLRNASLTQYGFTYYEVDEVERLLEEAGFGDVRMVSGSQRLGEFVCAICTKARAGMEMAE